MAALERAPTIQKLLQIDKYEISGNGRSSTRKTFDLISYLSIGNGKMDFQEFVQLMSKKNQLEMNLKEIKEAFRIFDQDDRGYVLTSELRQAFERLEEEIPEDELEEILEDSYHGKSRKLFFEEFKKMTRVQNYHSVTSSSHNCIN
ncbi:PREDICTED: calmodulin-2/4-like [Acropora digitifera]|uniref:calmodulin-2/4-like n=1 Tax=Acropora digitifera TaxID=70779 RepID=UPI00077A9A9B|nr:PREDICTED: calmodulin-2/4-like [Acropora digitifera]